VDDAERYLRSLLDEIAQLDPQGQHLLIELLQRRIAADAFWKLMARLRSPAVRFPLV
jgi:hypothetical protein